MTQSFRLVGTIAAGWLALYSITTTSLVASFFAGLIMYLVHQGYWNNYAITLLRLPDLIRQIHDSYKIEANSRKRKVMVKDTYTGSCPYCKNKTYEKVIHGAITNFVYYNCVCNKCKRTFKEVHNKKDSSWTERLWMEYQKPNKANRNKVMSSLSQPRMSEVSVVHTQTNNSIELRQLR